MLNNWRGLAGIQNCFDKGLSGAQLQYYNGNLYLFSGWNVNRSEITFNQNLCEFSLNNIQRNTWQPIISSSSYHNSTRGGSCVHEGFLYNIFGFSLNDTIPMALSTISRLNLSSNDYEWEEVLISGCESVLISRDSFGYSYSNGSIFINGGFSILKVLNSVIRLDLNNTSDFVQCEVLFNDSVSPRVRNGASMVYISGKYFLFGGQDRGTVFSDLWYFDIEASQWVQPITFGNNPTARYRHSYAAQGDYMIIKGGIGINNIILHDIFILDTKFLSWTEIIARSGSRIPPASYSSCLVIDFPKIYTVGGVEDSHITLSVWEFDLSTFVYTKLYDFDQTKDTGIFGHACYIDEIKGHKILSTLFGSTTLVDTAFNAIVKFNLSSSTITPKIYENTNMDLVSRSHFAYHSFNSEYILVIGGERNLQEFFDDIYFINKNTFEYYDIEDLLSPMYYSAFSYFNNSLFIFSGFIDNGISTYGPSNDISILVKFSNNTGKVLGLELFCGLGLGLVNNICELCEFGTYNPSKRSSTCLPCPAGTFNNILGATNVYQCTPCPYGTYSDQGSSICTQCSKDTTCFIGSTKSNSLSSSDTTQLKNFRSHKDQPKLFEPPNIINTKMILWIVCFSLIILFSIIFLISYKLRIFISFHDIFKNMHFEVHSTENGSILERDPSIKPSKLGGYLSVITIFLLLALACNSMITYILTNENREIILVPIDTLIEDQDFDSDSLKVTLMFSSYRGECSWTYLNLTYSENYYVESNSIENSDPFCYFHIHGKLNEVVETNDFISFYFFDPNAYSSDINVRLETHSSIPGQKSIVTQSIKTDNKSILRGVKYTDFYYSFLPAYYKETAIFEEITHLGYVLSITNSPSIGSTVPERGVGISSGLGIQINLNRIEIGITTFKFPRVEFFDFVIKFMNDFPGTIVLIGFFLWFIEYFTNMCKGKFSGRTALAKRVLAQTIGVRRGENTESLVLTQGIN